MNKLSINLLCSNSKQIAKNSVFSRLYSGSESDQIVISNKEYLTGVFPTITTPVVFLFISNYEKNSSHNKSNLYILV
jgi:hypothetical protein